MEAHVTFVVGKRAIENWDSNMDTRKNILQTHLHDGTQDDYRMVTTSTGNYGEFLDTRKLYI